MRSSISVLAVGLGLGLACGSPDDGEEGMITTFGSGDIGETSSSGDGDNDSGSDTAASDGGGAEDSGSGETSGGDGDGEDDGAAEEDEGGGFVPTCDADEDCPINDGIGGCEMGQCLPTISACIPTANYLDCASVCEEQGATCIEGGCDGASMWLFGTPDACMSESPDNGLASACDKLFAQHPEPVARCCCR